MFATKLWTATLAVLVLVAAVGPAAAAGGQASSSVTATVQVTDEATIITVQEDGSAAANAEVTVSSVADASLAASGTYTTDANGTVRLPAPDADANVRLSIEHDTVQATATLRLQAPESGSWQTTVSFDADATTNEAGNAAVSTQHQGDAEMRSGDDASAQSNWDVVGQLALPFDLGFGAQASGDMGNDTTVAGEYDLEQSENSSSGQAEANASGEAAGSDDAEGDAAQSENNSSAQTTVAVDVDGHASGDGDAETSGGLNADVTSSANASADGVVDIIGLGSMDIQSQLALAMTSE